MAGKGSGGGPRKGARNNPHGRPKSATIQLTHRAREIFEQKLASNIGQIFDALLEAGTQDREVPALVALISRAIPTRKGAPVVCYIQFPQAGGVS
jgi:hypothetical protein